jgi:hypothetical protein
MMAGLLDRNKKPAGLLGFGVRDSLYPGEEKYFRDNPTVGGMAAETDDIILNPYSPATVNRESVAKNEAFRLHLRKNGIVPTFQLTDEQREFFKGTPYEGNDNLIRETIAARMYSGDPSANATPEQVQWLQQMMPR